MGRYGNEDSNSSQCFHRLGYDRKGRDQREKTCASSNAIGTTWWRERGWRREQRSGNNVNFPKRQAGMESRYRWKDATTISVNIKHKILHEKKVFGKAIQKLYVPNSEVKKKYI